MLDYLRKIFKIKSTWSLLLISVFSLFLSFFRLIYSGNQMYIFMIWNLFLAFVPWLIASWIYIKEIRHPMVTGLLMLVWLVFFPNAPYLLTDLIHLGKENSLPLWYDLILFLSYALAGVLYGFVSLDMIQRRLPLKRTRLLCIFLIYLSCFGIYLGRFLRWNSWDLLTNFGGIFQDVLQRISDPFQHRSTWGFTFLFGTLLNILFYSYRHFSLPLEEKENPNETNISDSNMPDSSNPDL